MPNVAGLQRVRHLFDKFSKRQLSPKTSPTIEARVSSRKKDANLVDPFEYFIQNDVVKSWTSQISSLVRGNKPHKAVSMFKSMLNEGRRPNFVTVVSFLKAVRAIGSKELACGVHGYSIKTGLTDSQVEVVTALVGIYSSLDMRNVWKLFDAMHDKDVVLFSQMISACAGNGMCVEAFNLAREMVVSGLQPNYVTIASLLPACAELGVLLIGREIHGYCIRRMLCDVTVLSNALVDMYSKCRHLEAAIRVSDKMLEKDVVSWRIVMRGCVENQSPRKAFEIFQKLRAQSIKELDEYVILEVIGSYSQVDENCIRHGFFSFLIKSGLVSFASVATELLQVLAKFGDIESAQKIFDELIWKDLISWSAMISVYAQSKNTHNAFAVLRDMQLANYKPNEVTFVSLLLACTSSDSMETGESIHCQIIKSGYSTNTFLTSALIDMYCKFGRTQRGKSIFDENPTKDLICWSSMINGYGINGLGEEVLEVFQHMLSCGIKPNNVVFISLLSACSHCGLEYEGWSLFHAMDAIYGIKPELAHYTCMVDMLSRQGNIKEALEFVNNMPVEPDKRIWGAILAGCRNTNGPTDVVAKKLKSLDPENTSCYVVLSNLYADQGRWEEVEKLRGIIDISSLKKVAGYSSI